MRYLHRQAARRKDPRKIAEWARSIVVVLDCYYYDDSEPLNPDGPVVARYARPADYHTVTGSRLEALAAWLVGRGAGQVRAFVDAGPVPERELAQRAGLGWIGKNTMLIRPGLGSWTFIGSVFTDLELPPDAPFTADRCGSCRRCLDACPTDAFVGPRVLDATRCISYLTIEQKGPIPAEFTPLPDRRAFGCDICNEVCPWNERFAESSTVPALAPLPETDLSALPANWFDRMTDEEFAERYGHTAFARAGREGMGRNMRGLGG